MIQWAADQFALEKRIGKASLREHLESVARQTGQTDERLTSELPPLPIMQIFGYWAELARCRGNGFSGPEPIRPADLDAWCRLMGITLEPYEVAAIFDIDGAFMRAMQEGRD